VLANWGTTGGGDATTQVGQQVLRSLHGL